jgi:hypothetical protein
MLSLDLGAKVILLVIDHVVGIASSLSAINSLAPLVTILDVYYWITQIHR